MKSGFVIRSTIEDLLPGNREPTPEIGLKNLKQTFSTVSFVIACFETQSDQRLRYEVLSYGLSAEAAL